MTNFLFKETLLLREIYGINCLLLWSRLPNSVNDLKEEKSLSVTTNLSKANSYLCKQRR